MTRIRSITEQVYVSLRSDLIACRIKPGSRLRTIELSKRFGVSLSAVREALARPSADGLALAEAHMGVEALCIQRTLLVGDTARETRLAASFDELLAVPIKSHYVSFEYAAAYTAYENALVAACDNPWLMRLRATLSAQAERYKERDAALTVSLVAKVRRINTARFLKVLEGSVDEIQFSRGSIVRDEVMKAWLVLDYAQCREIESNEALFSNPCANASDLMKRIRGGRQQYHPDARGRFGCGLRRSKADP
jgi:DNA-binding GntR family transcriptional regulator